MEMNEETARTLQGAVADLLASSEQLDELTSKIEDAKVMSHLEDAKGYADDAMSASDRAMNEVDDAMETMEELEEQIQEALGEINAVQKRIHTIMDIIEPFMPKAPLTTLEGFIKRHRNTIRGLYFDLYVDRGPYDGIIISITKLAEFFEVKLNLDAIDRAKLEEITLELSPA